MIVRSVIVRYPSMDQPTLLLDKQRCLRNLRRMSDRAEAAGVRLRPHCKTHQSLAVGRWLRDAGIDRITVSSVTMAEYFARDGWADILIAFPLNPLALDRIETLAERCRLAVLLDNPDALAGLARRSGTPLGFFVDIDTGYGRTGIPMGQTEEVERLLTAAEKVSGLEFRGFYGHAGDSYYHQDRDDRQRVLDQALGGLARLKQHFSAQHPQVLTGDTPSCSATSRFPGVDELTAGNFIFYDLFQAALGSCTEDDIAVAMACPVVGRYPDRGQVVIHGGGVHFSKEQLEHRGAACFGKTARARSSGWQVDPDPVWLRALSQEHGTVTMPPERLAQTRIGDVLYLLPVHSCLTADAMGSYRGLDGAMIDHL